MQYITIKRYKRPDRPGRKGVNIPYGEIIEEQNNRLYYHNIELCNDHSAVMREYFARNDDGQGLKRGKLSQSIIKTLLARPDETREEHQKRWDVVYDDKLVCPKYRKTAENSGDWLWNIEFYNAPIEDLEYIAKLVGAKGVT